MIATLTAARERSTIPHFILTEFDEDDLVLHKIDEDDRCWSRY